jgi:hypothetical protein
MPAPKTFQNRCEMDLAKATFIAIGPCEGTITPCKPWEHQTKKGSCVACGDEEGWDRIKEICLAHASLANPASVNCAKLGGVSAIVTTSAGQYSNCKIPKAKLYQAMKALGLENFSQKISDPASANCIAISTSKTSSKRFNEEYVFSQRSD